MFSKLFSSFLNESTASSKKVFFYRLSSIKIKASVVNNVIYL